MYIAGRQFPVKLYQTIQPQEDYLDSAIVTIFQIHTEQPDGDILTFLTGQEEIEAVEKLIIEHAKLLPVTAKKVLIKYIYIFTYINYNHFYLFIYNYLYIYINMIS